MRVVLLVPIRPDENGNGLAQRAGLHASAFAGDRVHLVVVPAASPEGFLRHPDGSEEQLGKPDDPHVLVRELMANRTWRNRLLRMGDGPALMHRAQVGWARPVVEHVLAADDSDPVDAVIVLRSYLLPLAVRVVELLRRSAPTDARPALVADLDDDDESTFRQLGLPDADAMGSLLAAFADAPDLVVLASAAEAQAVAKRHQLGSVELLPNATRLSVPVGRIHRSPGSGHHDMRSATVRVLMVGNFTYYPNREGAEWFIESVLPLISRPTTLELVGTDSDRLADMVADQRVTGCGFVDDLAPHYEAADVVVVPVRVGGGTRIKILEAAAYCVPIVSCSVGAAGHGLEDGVHLLVRDDPAEFAAAVDLLCSDDVHHRTMVRQLVDTAHTAIHRFDRVDVASGFRNRVHELVKHCRVG
jgi:glycosyltransferase involved in cell wall biosynthesis